MLRHARFALLGACFVAGPAFALSLEAPLSDAATEARAKTLFHEIRCVVCQGESIADSPADVASALRRDVRERLSAGVNEEAIKAELVSQYGDSVLMRPPVNGTTGLLWAGPLLVLAAGLLFARRYFRQAR